MLHSKYLDKKHLIASRQVLVCDNDPAVFLTKAIDLPENSDPCHPYDLGFLTANIQNNRMVLDCLPLLFLQCCK